MPSILAGSQLVPEFVQADARPERLAAALVDWLTSSGKVRDYEQQCVVQHRLLKRDAASEAAAQVLALAQQAQEAAGVFVAGVDEAGRGPLAGPVIAAAVILDPNKPLDGLRDSKKMTGRQRDLAFESLHRHALAIGVGQADSREIDELNILHATMLAMRRAVDAPSCRPASVLVDGNRCPELLMPADAIIGGDGTIPSISAASLIAKVTRDRSMLELHERYPEYGFDRHKCYPTKAHRLAR